MITDGVIAVKRFYWVAFGYVLEKFKRCSCWTSSRNETDDDIHNRLNIIVVFYKTYKWLGVWIILNMYVKISVIALSDTAVQWWNISSNLLTYTVYVMFIVKHYWHVIYPIYKLHIYVYVIKLTVHIYMSLINHIDICILTTPVT